MIKPRVLCTIDRAMGFGDAVMAFSTLLDLAEKYEVRVMCPDKSFGIVKLFNSIGIKPYNVSQQGHFYHNDHLACYNLIYWDVYNSLRNLPHQALNCMRELANLPIFTKELARPLPELPISVKAMEKIKLMIEPLKKPIILVHPLISYWNKMISSTKYQQIINSLTKLNGTVIQIGTSVSADLINPNCINLLDKTSLDESLALIKLADVIFCGDTFIQHAAATLKTPAAVFFNGTAPMDFGYPFFSNIFNPKLAPCQTRCGRPMRWIYDYSYSDPNKWDTRGEAGWICPVKICETAVSVEQCVTYVQNELKKGRDRDWSFYDPKVEDYL